MREESKGEAAFEKIAAIRKLAEGQVEIWKLDMASYESILAFAERAGSLKRLDFVILNAGVYRTRMHFNASTGHEEDLQTNYLSTVLLVLLFVGIFKDQRHSAPVPMPGRIVIVSSDVASRPSFAHPG